MFFSFGKKRSVKRSSNKPSAALLKICRSCGVSATIKRGSRRVYRSTAVLKKLCLKKLRSHLKMLTRGSSFGFGPFVQPKAYGYHQKVKRHPGSLPQTNAIVTSKNNINRPPGTGLTSKYIPTYGSYARFFTEKVPKVVGPRSIGFMGQPDGTLYAVGSPFYRYTHPATHKPKRASTQSKSVTGAKLNFGYGSIASIARAKSLASKSRKVGGVKGKLQNKARETAMKAMFNKIKNKLM